MSQTFKIISAAILSAAAITAIVVVNRREETILTIREKPGQAVRLPPPKTQGGMAVAEALANRRSVREFSERLLTQEGIAQLCWAAQGITDKAAGFRTAPSAGALYPAVVFVVDASGAYEYEPAAHALRQVIAGDPRLDLHRASYDQRSVGTAPFCMVIAVDVSRTATKYGNRAERYCLIEAGHIAQNVLLQATADGLAGVSVGAFDDRKIAALLKLPPNLQPVYLLPIGYAR